MILFGDSLIDSGLSFSEIIEKLNRGKDLSFPEWYEITEELYKINDEFYKACGI